MEYNLHTLYAPRNLRQLLFGRSQDNKIQYGVSDLQKTNGEEVASKFHSPIIGWAYDGNPICELMDSRHKREEQLGQWNLDMRKLRVLHVHHPLQ